MSENRKIRVKKVIEPPPERDHYYRPFNLCDYDIEFVDEDYDFIITNQATIHKLLDSYEDLSKTVIYTNSDNPHECIKESVSFKFIAQPDRKLKDLVAVNAMPVPLNMGDHIPIHEDNEYIEYLRDIPKKYDYYFAGNLSYYSRDILAKLNLSNSIIKSADNVYAKTSEERLECIKRYLEELAQARFGFAPRGAGSSSFRLYECLLVGTVPIITDQIQLPFTEEVDWGAFSISGSIFDIWKLIEKSQTINISEYRELGIDFFDQYCNTRKLNNILIESLLKRSKNENNSFISGPLLGMS